uniref:EGF-like domain-containing protein n=1 Tax=Meloidogyne hapla TaxID=6305 RepID=A0A1I8BNN7_MELHA
MNYNACPVFIQHDLNNYKYGIDAFGLLNLSKSTRGPLVLSFSMSPDFSDEFKLEFFRAFHFRYYDESLLHGANVDDVQCNYEAIDYRGEHSVLNLCNIADLSSFINFSGLLRHNGNLFVFGHLNGKLFFFRDSPNCEWHVRDKRSDKTSLKNRMPTYYSEYIDGIKRWVELILIADNSIYKKYGEDKKKINERLHAIASSVNSLYDPLNVRVILTWADIWEDKNAVDVTENPDGTLRDFLGFRRSLLAKGHSHDNAQLLTDVRFGSVIGKAYKARILGTMCSFDYSGGVIVDHSDNPVFVGMTVAHEMGHNFGMDHDISPSCKCPVDSCIMAPSSSSVNASSYFSDCSLDTLSSALRRGVDYCLHNVPSNAFGGAKCGNGVLEDGEDCDCGSTTTCPNSCCIAAECKLAPEAECAEGDCCDLNVCKLKKMASECRRALNTCDLPEYCDGKNPSCPADFFVQDGHSCPDGASEAFCYQGLCGRYFYFGKKLKDYFSSRKQQCQFLWGPSADNSVPECYDFNEIGAFSGNCGYRQDTDQYIPCNPNDTTCGRLHCNHESDKPIFGDPSTIYSAHSFVRTSSGKDETCRVVRTTIAGTGGKRKADPGMICVNAACHNKTAILEMVSRCDPEDCNSRGICNNVGNCHCASGYGGVACDLPGFGGSVNSGPASTDAFNPAMTFLYLFSFAFILFVIASVYFKKKKGFWLHKRIWSKLCVLLELRSFNLIPIRRAPARPDTHLRQEELRRQSFNAVWNDNGVTTVRGEVLRVDAARPYPLAPISATSLNQSVPKSIQKHQIAIQEQKSLVTAEGYDTGKSSSSTSSDEPPPPVPPHRNVKMPAIPKIITASKNEASEKQSNNTSKIDVKSLAARFEKM